MDLCSITEIRALLAAHGFHFSKALGQNFLIDASVPERIAEASGAAEGVTVLEIGPGIGCLTAQLAQRAERVVAVELDDRLLPVLTETLADYPNVRVVHGDIMKLPLDTLDLGENPAVAANLPYNITSPVLTRLLEAEMFQSVTVMVQREVARRMTAAPSSADYGAFTLLCRWYTEPRYLFEVPPSAFEPRPKVTSAVVRLDRRTEPPAACDRALFFRVVRAAFNQRRKTLANALSSGFPQLGKAAVAESIEEAGLSPAVRGEVLDLAAFAAVTDAIGKRLT